MSAPKTPEGRAAALAKRRETQRPKSLGELKAAVEHVASLFGHHANDSPPETETVGWIFLLLANFVTTRRLPEGCNERLREYGYALGDLLQQRPGLRTVVTVDRRGLHDLLDAIRRRSAYLESAGEIERADRPRTLNGEDEATVAALLGAPEGKGLPLSE